MDNQENKLLIYIWFVSLMYKWEYVLQYLIKRKVWRPLADPSDYCTDCLTMGAQETVGLRLRINVCVEDKGGIFYQKLLLIYSKPLLLLLKDPHSHAHTLLRLSWHSALKQLSRVIQESGGLWAVTTTTALKTSSIIGFVYWIVTVS